MNKKEILKRVKEIEKKEPSPNEKLVKVNITFKDLVTKVLSTRKKK